MLDQTPKSSASASRSAKRGILSVPAESVGPQGKAHPAAGLAQAAPAALQLDWSRSGRSKRRQHCSKCFHSTCGECRREFLEAINDTLDFFFFPPRRQQFLLPGKSYLCGRNPPVTPGPCSPDCVPVWPWVGGEQGNQKPWPPLALCCLQPPAML